MESVRALGRETFASLYKRNYRLFFIGQAISLSGTWMQTVALGWLVLELTNSGSQLGLVIAAQFLPVLFFGPWGGVVVDRLNKRKLLIATQVAFGLLTLAVYGLVVSNTLEAWMLYVFALASGFVRVFDNPLRETFVSQMVPPSEFKNAVSLNAAENNLARAIGPSIAGAVIALSGTAICFLANGLSYIPVIITLVLMREEDFYETTTTRRRKGQLMAGFHYVKRSKLIRNILIMIAVVGTFAYEFQVSLPIFARETFGQGAGGYAGFLSAFGVGAVIGGLYAASRKHTSEQRFMSAMAVFGATMVITALAPTLALATAGMFFVGMLAVNVTSMGNTMLQLEAEPQMRGRVMALWTVAMIGSTPIGGPLIGLIGENLGGRAAIAVGGFAALLTALSASFMLKRRERLREITPEVHLQGQIEHIGSNRP